MGKGEDLDMNCGLWCGVFIFLGGMGNSYVNGVAFCKGGGMGMGMGGVCWERVTKQ